MWADEAAAVQESGRSLTELRSVGPFTAHFIAQWLRDSPDPPTPPQLRDGFITYAHARTVVDAHPEWRDVARADNQMHTDETDGSSTIEDMAEAAATIGRERVAITDHSKTLRITNGMDEARLVAQGEHIAAVNARGSGPVVLRGIEMDLTPEGAGDMDPPVLARLDLVLGAFHSKLRLRDDQTERYLRGLENPDIQVLAHPRGRIYNFRAGLSCDWERVARHAVETGKRQRRHAALVPGPEGTERIQHGDVGRDRAPDLANQGACLGILLAQDLRVQDLADPVFLHDIGGDLRPRRAGIVQVDDPAGRLPATALALADLPERR